MRWMRSVPALGFAAALAAAPVLPDGARHTLDDTWKGWQLAEVPKTGTDTCADGLKDGDSAVLATADFDGDGFKDYALQIVAGNRPRVVVLRGRLEGFTPYELPGTAEPGAVVLRVVPAGTPYHDRLIGLDTFFLHETLEVTHCGTGDRTAYLWNGLSFDALVIPGSRASTPPQD